MPVPIEEHPLAAALALRTLRLNCMTNAYADLWEVLFDKCWTNEVWACDWQGLELLNERAARPLAAEWDAETPLRCERARRAALVELDALVSVWLGISADQLVALYLGRFPQLVDYEATTWFDAHGRKIVGDRNAFGRRQTTGDYERLVAYLDDPERNPVPEGYTPPFYKADRENE